MSNDSVPMEMSRTPLPRDATPESSVYLMEHESDEDGDGPSMERHASASPSPSPKTNTNGNNNDDDSDDDFGKPYDDGEEESQLDQHDEEADMDEKPNQPPAPTNVPATSTATSTSIAASAGSSTEAASSNGASVAPVTSTATNSTASSTPAPASASTPSDSSYKKDHSKSWQIAVKRLLSDFKQMETDPPEGVSGAPMDMAAPFVWRCAVFGPSDTTWEGGVFQLVMQFPDTYPQKPPTVRFSSKMYHPNVFSDGGLCLDIIQDKWSPVYSVSTILTSIQSLLSDPNPASPANPDAAKLYASKNEADQKEYRKRVRACVEKSTE